MPKDSLELNTLEAQAVKTYVKNKISTMGGKFVVFDKKANQAVQITLASFPEKKAMENYPGIFVQGALFRTPDGTPYVLDFFLRKARTADKRFDVYRVMIREAGATRYSTWKQNMETRRWVQTQVN